QASRRTWGFLSISAEQFGLFWLNNGLLRFGLICSIASADCYLTQPVLW
ncbi:hypothetical protein VIS19158_15124, partial [Vibrio scophthalmi LMG 19158]